MPIETIAEARTLVLVVEGGSLSAAARALQISPNAVSQRVRSLEARAGTRLLHRTTRSLSLTEEGEALYRRCLRVVAEVDAAEADLAGGAPLRGRVRIVVPTALAGPSALAALGRLHTAHPDLGVQLLVSDDRSLDLVGAGVDLALHYGEPPDSGLIVRRLGETAFGLCATTGYLDARGRPQTPADLAGHTALRFLSDRPQTSWALAGEDGTPVEAEIAGWFESDSSRALADAVYAGLGVGVRPVREIEAGALERVLPECTFGRAPLVALMAPGRHRLPRVRAVLDALAAVVTREILAAPASCVVVPVHTGVPTVPHQTASPRGPPSVCEGRPVGRRQRTEAEPVTRSGVGLAPWWAYSAEWPTSTIRAGPSLPTRSTPETATASTRPPAAGKT